MEEVIIELWDTETLIYLGDEVITQFEYSPSLTGVEEILSALGYSVQIIDRRLPLDTEDADESLYVNNVFTDPEE